MTTQKHDQSEEQAFEDFLQGRGELVKQLKALSQLTPSAALDAAILASAKAAVAQAERSKETAANDPVAPRKPGFLSRYRMPLAMAASLMIAVLVAVQWYAQSDNPASIQVAQAPSAEPASPPAASQPQLAQADTKAKDVSESASRNSSDAPPSLTAAAKPSNSIAKAKAMADEKKAETLSGKQAETTAVAANESLKPSADQPNAAPAQLAQADTALQTRSQSSATQALRAAPPVVTAFVPAPAAPPAPAPAMANPSRELAKMAAAPPPPEAGATASSGNVKTDGQEKQKAWIARIEEMIKAGSRNEAVAEWEKFEKAYPNYAAYSAPEKLKAQIKALKN
jgi:hypothetical protein